MRRLGRLAMPRGRAHWAESWPHLALERAGPGGPGRVLWRGRPVAPLLPVAALADRMGPEAVIFGSGPSLRGQGLGSVPPGAAILLNGALSLAPRLGGALAAAIVDERFVWAHREMVARHLPEAGFLLLSPPAMRALLDIDRSALEGRQVILVDNLAEPWRGARRRGAEALAALGPWVVCEGEAALSLDPDRGVASTGTVAFEALQVVLAARPARIGLAGIDIDNAREPRFHEGPGATHPSSLLAKRDSIVAHFALAHAVAAGMGVALECYSAASALLDAGIPYSDRLDRA